MTEHVKWTLVAIDDLHEAPDNPRTISEYRLRELQVALLTTPEMLEARPVIADSAKGNEIVGGNMRHRAAAGIIELHRTNPTATIVHGEKHYPVSKYVERFGEAIPAHVRKFKDENERREWMLRDNNPYGDYEDDALQQMVREHQESGGDVALLGFSEPRLEDLLGTGEPDPTNGDDDPANQQIPEVWGVIVDCETEEEQVKLLERLESEGMEVRALIS